MKYLVFAFAAFGFISCNSEKKNNEHAHTQKNEVKQKIYDYKTHDPVCGMEREAGWEFYSVYNNDTVQFCAEHCKKGFDINPEKYTTVQ